MNNDTTDSRTKEDNTYEICKCHEVNSFFFVIRKSVGAIYVDVNEVGSIQMFNLLCVHTYLAYLLTSDETKHARVL